MIGTILRMFRPEPTRREEEIEAHRAMIRHAVRRAHRAAYQPPRRRSRWEINGARETVATIDAVSLLTEGR